VYDSRVNREAWWYRTGLSDTTVSFGVSGILRDGALVMYDRATYSLWTQAGVAFAGVARGTRLSRIPSLRTTWWVWKEGNPNTLVMRPAPIPRSRSGSPTTRGFRGRSGSVNRGR
jgi:hypothetical protein